MYIEKHSLDDIVHELLVKIQKYGINQNNSKGPNKEILGAYIKLANPLNRISTSFAKSIFVSPIGEFLWYMSGSDKLNFIEYYIDQYVDASNNKESLNGAYGPRLFNKENKIFDQIQNTIDLLKKKPNTRQAVIQIFDKNDLLIMDNLDIPCTCTLQFFIRDNKLVLFVTMRSNDVFVGLPHDIFCFTMLQEIIAKQLGRELGEYHHFIGSCHYYEKNEKRIGYYLSEGLQTTKTQMKAMPESSSLETIVTMLEYESKIREGIDFNFDDVKLDPYWKDLLYMLKVYAIKKNNSNKEFREEIKKLLHLFDNENYRIYLKEKYDL